MKFMCEFVGGKWNGVDMDLDQAVALATGKMRNYSKERSQGILVHRAELDDKPTFSDYLGPMWDGLRYNGKSSWQVSDEVKATVEPVAILRYESQKVYDMLSH